MIIVDFKGTIFVLTEEVHSKSNNIFLKMIHARIISDSLANNSSLVQLNLSTQGSLPMPYRSKPLNEKKNLLIAWTCTRCI